MWADFDLQSRNQIILPFFWFGTRQLFLEKPVVPGQINLYKCLYRNSVLFVRKSEADRMAPLRVTKDKPCLRVGVLGAGAIGAVFGLRLSSLRKRQPSSEAIIDNVVLVGRRHGNLGQVVAKGKEEFTIVDNITHATETYRIHKDFHVAFSDDDDSGDSLHAGIRACNVLLVAVKTTATTSVANQLASILPKDSTMTIVSLQNGIRNADILQKAFLQHPNVQVLTSVVTLPAEWATGTTTFHINFSGGCTVEQPTCEPHKSRIVTLVTALREAHLPSHTTTRDIKVVQYTKWMINLVNPINALAGQTVPETMAQRGYRLVLAAAVTEARHVILGKCCNQQFTWWQRGKLHFVSTVFALLLVYLPDFVWRWIFSHFGAQYKSSMLQDLERRRSRTEIQNFSGEIVQLSRNSNVKVPVNAALVKLVQNAEEAGKGSPQLSPQELMRLVGLT